MSEQDNINRGVTSKGSPVVVVEIASSKHTMPYRPTELHNEGEPDLHQKCAPAVASLTEKWKDSSTMVDTDFKENELEMAQERQRHVVKSLSMNVTSVKRGGLSPVAIAMTSIETEPKMDEVKSSSRATVSKPVSPIPDMTTKKEDLENKGDDDSITSEITELRTPEVEKKTTDWEDDEEPGGLPRTESRASRVSRAVRQLFCCGLQIEAPSEDNVSSPRSGFFNSGI